MTLETDRGWDISFYQEEDEEVDIKHEIGEHEISQILAFNDKKSLTWDEKSDIKPLDVSLIYNTKSPIDLNYHKSLLPEAMNRKIKTVKSEIVVYFFNTNRRIVFTRNELKQHFGEDSKMTPIVSNFIPYIVKQYCKLYLYFEPMQVNHEYFEIKIANLLNKEDPLLNPFHHQEDLNLLFECVSLVLVRKQKSSERILAWKEKYKDDSKEVLEIIIPFQRELLEKIEKNKTINALKEKILTYSNLTNIVILTYTDFKICEPRKKIWEICDSDRILEVYCERVNQYEDIPQVVSPRERRVDYLRLPAYTINEEFEVKTSFFWGKQYLHIVGTKIVQKYEGGMMGYILGHERQIERSLYTLVGIGCNAQSMKLQFMRKDGQEVCQYYFSSPAHQEEFLKKVLCLGRELSQNFAKIQ